MHTRFQQSDYSGGSHQQSEFPVVVQQITDRQLTSQQQEDARLLELIRKFRHERTDPDTALNEIDLLLGFPTDRKLWHRLLSIRDWLRAEGKDHD